MGGPCILILLISFLGGNFAIHNYYGSVDHINEINSQKLPWKAGNNFPEGLTWDRMKRMVGSNRRSNIKKNPYVPAADEKFPDSLDLRTKYPQCPTIGTVYDQGNCMSAWAIAPTSVLTDTVCIVTDGKRKSALSFQHVLSCCHLCGRGCRGGWDDSAFFFFKRVGACTGGDYQSNEGCHPYTIPPCVSRSSPNSTTGCSDAKPLDTEKCRYMCSNKNYKTPFKNDTIRADTVFDLTTINASKTYLATHGPVDANYPVYTDFYTYTSGVYIRSANAKLVGYHCVKVIGYGKENNLEYWIAVNSWGKHWGNNGTFKVAIDVNKVDFDAKFIGAKPIL